MLVLTRNIGERIILEYPSGVIVEVEVLNVKGKQAKIGFTAPDEVNIVRDELLTNTKR